MKHEVKIYKIDRSHYELRNFNSQEIIFYIVEEHKKLIHEKGFCRICQRGKEEKRKRQISVSKSKIKLLKNKRI